MDLEGAVVAAWQATADELPGIRAVLDQHRAEPLDEAMAAAMRKSAAKEHVLLAVMAGRAERARRRGAAPSASAIEARARDRPAARCPAHARPEAAPPARPACSSGSRRPSPPDRPSEPTAPGADAPLPAALVPASSGAVPGRPVMMAS